MAQATITLTVKVAWWVIPYIRACAVFAVLFGVVPDGEKIVRTCMRGIKLVVR